MENAAVFLIAEEAAPAWVPFVALAVPAVIIALVLTWAVRMRRRTGRARRAQRRRAPASAVELGSAQEIADPSGYSIEAVLKAMAVKPEDHGPTDGMPHDEGWMGTMLGLRSRLSASSNVLEPHLYWGEREHGQVFIRVGPDEEIEGGTTMLSNRHVRSITVLRRRRVAVRRRLRGRLPARVAGEPPGAERPVGRDPRR